MAGGFTVEEKNIDAFRDYLIKSFEKSKTDMSSLTNIEVDSLIAPTAINENFYNDVNYLSPFGPGNNEPKFVIENLKVIKSYLVGKNHIKSILSGSDGHSFKSLTWNAVNTPFENILISNNKKKFDALGKIKLNDWAGKKDVEFIIEDISLN